MPVLCRTRPQDIAVFFTVTLRTKCDTHFVLQNVSTSLLWCVQACMCATLCLEDSYSEAPDTYNTTENSIGNSWSYMCMYVCVCDKIRWYFVFPIPHVRYLSQLAENLRVCMRAHDYRSACRASNCHERLTRFINDMRASTPLQHVSACARARAHTCLVGCILLVCLCIGVLYVSGRLRILLMDPLIKKEEDVDLAEDEIKCYE